MLATGIAQNRKEKLGIKFIVGNAERLPFESGRFDVVVAKHMLYHLQHPQKGINEMRRCLADHGTMIITLNSKGNTPLLHECSLMICRKYGLTSMHGYGYISTESVKRYLKGFKVAKPIITKSRIDRPDMFPAYFASFRDFYRPYPNDRKWAMMIDDVRKFVDKRLAKEGKFIETRTMGIIYAVKKGG